MHEYTDFEYLTECSNGCGALGGWLPSREIAEKAGRNHEKDKGHKWMVKERMRR